jgi:hypothetical protein
MSTIPELKAKYGRLVIIDIDGKTLAFKPLNKDKITDLKKQISKAPDLALNVSINACEFCCVLGAEHFKELADSRPLAFAGNSTDPGVIDALMDLARGNGVIRTE